MMGSVWANDIDIKEYESLKEDTKTQVAVIGGGIAGILIAYILEKRGVETIILEADRILNGVTKNTTAKVTSQHGLIYDKLIRNFGKEKAYKYFRANELAIKTYKDISRKIDFDFIELPSIVYSFRNRANIEKELEATNTLGIHAEFLRETELPFEVEAAIKFDKQAQMNPLKLLKQLSENLTIYEKTEVVDIKDNIAYTKNAKVRAEKFVIATHFPFINRYGLYFLKMYQERSYVLALGGAQKLNGMYIDDVWGLSFRNYKDLLLLGGYSARTGKTCEGFKRLRTMAQKIYPYSGVDYSWATQDCMTPDNVPYIGRYTKLKDNLFVATGFNKWGMTSSMVSALIISDLILDKENDFSDVFSPQRPFLNRKQVYVNMGESFINIIKPKPKRCSHMGCALNYNSEENSYDCPCHGSRFTKDGRLIDNPAKKGIDIN